MDIHITNKTNKSWEVVYIMEKVRQLFSKHRVSKIGDRSFSFASSSVWNSIPNDIRCAPSLSSSTSRLKTYLFRSAYKD